MRIGLLARGAGVSVDTVRFYERRGLLAPPSRTPADYRDYPARTLERLGFIRASKDLGFTLTEIGALLRLGRTSDLDCEPLKTRTARKVADINRKLLQLRRMKRALQRLVRDCEARSTTGTCPSLCALARAAR